MRTHSSFTFLARQIDNVNYIQLLAIKNIKSTSIFGTPPVAAQAHLIIQSSTSLTAHATTKVPINNGAFGFKIPPRPAKAQTPGDSDIFCTDTQLIIHQLRLLMLTVD